MKNILLAKLICYALEEIRIEYFLMKKSHENLQLSLEICIFPKEKKNVFQCFVPRNSLQNINNAYIRCAYEYVQYVIA